MTKLRSIFARIKASSILRRERKDGVVSAALNSTDEELKRNLGRNHPPIDPATGRFRGPDD